jgi:hypothetical protein
VDLAPCIAVVGPANAGKTTLLHLLDEKLQRRLKAALVIKGSPDHTGRYLFHAPNLREALKEDVKGQWGATTIEHICESITCGRAHLEIALLDFGGRHNPENDRMLQRCSHYIVVSRRDDTAAGASWDEVAARNGLQRVAWMRSMGARDAGAPEIARSSHGWEGVFRWDVQAGDDVNDAVIAPLVEEIIALRRDLAAAPYIDLHFLERWKESDIEELRGRSAEIRAAVGRSGKVALGGAAPKWAYLGGLRCALETRRDARIFCFDPTLPLPLVELPAARSAGSFPEGVLEVRWSRDHSRLKLHMTAADKFLPPEAALNLAHAPDFGDIPVGEVCLWGKGPIWLYGAYARWLIAAGVARLRTFDLNLQKAVRVWP